MYLIIIELPRDRHKRGTLWLYDKEGILIKTMKCLGKADNQNAQQNHNASRNPSIQWGDTPTGVYHPATVDVLPDDHHLGKQWIRLEGKVGQSLEARKRGKRSGLAIHAGRDGDRLVPTYGCIRVLQSDFNVLCNNIGDDQVRTIIVEQTL